MKLLVGLFVVLWLIIEINMAFGHFGVFVAVLIFGGLIWLSVSQALSKGKPETPSVLIPKIMNFIFRPRKPAPPPPVVYWSSNLAPVKARKPMTTSVSPPTIAVSGTKIDRALESLPANVQAKSGSVFYTGREAYTGRRPLYILGLNPGGDPVQQSGNTVAKHIGEYRARQGRWSAYANDSWEGAAPGTWGMQPTVLHMLRKLGLDPQLTPASNVVFARTRGEKELREEKATLLRACWPVHQAVIDELGVKVIVCFGKTAGKWVCDQVGAKELIDTYKETNDRGWTSSAHRAANGLIVVSVSHPGRADWRNPEADPTPLIKRALETAGR